MDSYHKTMFRVNEDMVPFQKNYLEQARKKKKGPEAKYAIYGFFLALQYWAFEVVERVGSKFATYHGLKSPRMLSWSSNKVPSAKKLV